MKQIIKKIMIPAVILALCTVTLPGCGKQAAQPAATAPQSTEKPAASVTGTGVLEADKNFVVNAGVTGDVTAAPFAEGDHVKAGDILYKIDSTDIMSNIEKMRVTIEKTQLAYRQTQDNIDKLTVRAGIGGTVQNVYVKTGDMVAANGKIADIVNDSVMLLKVPFIQESAAGIYPGQAASVTIVGTFYTTGGTVRRVASGQSASADGSVTKIVEIEVQNPGSVMKGDKGTAIIGDIACSDAGVFEYYDERTVVAEMAGKVSKLPVNAGDKVSSGSLLAALESDALSAQQQQNSLAIKEAQVGLETLSTQLRNYSIASAIDGVVTMKKIDKSDKLTAANMNGIMTVEDLSKIKFKMNVDEMDVSKVTVGQRVSVTPEATPDQEFEGIVDYVSPSGTVVSGVALYEITVVMQQTEGLRPGMNVSAKIHTEQ